MKRFSAVFAALSLLLIPASAQATGNGGHGGSDKGKVTICHATGSSTNPYVQITPSKSGVYHGHIAHQHGEDIIPPFTYKGQTYSQNWDAAGQAIWNNGCKKPTTTPPPTCGGPHNPCPPPPCGGKDNPCPPPPVGYDCEGNPVHPGDTPATCPGTSYGCDGKPIPPGGTPPTCPGTPGPQGPAGPQGPPGPAGECKCEVKPPCEAKPGKKCPKVKNLKFRLFGPSVVGPSPEARVHYVVGGPVKHLKKVVFYVNGVKKKVDKKRAFTYTTKAKHLRGTEEPYGKKRLVAKLHVKCGGVLKVVKLVMNLDPPLKR